MFQIAMRKDSRKAHSRYSRSQARAIGQCVDGQQTEQWFKVVNSRYATLVRYVIIFVYSK